MTHFRNIIEFTNYFNSEDTCRKYLEQQRWPDGIICPFCESKRVYRFSDGKRFKCAEKTCNKKFTVIVGTIYENTKIPLQKFFLAMYLIGNHKKGISSCQLARDLGITQKTAWFIMHRIRDMYIDKSEEKLSQITEVDETYCGGKMKNKHKSIRKKAHEENASHTDNKTPVVALLERDNKVKTHVWDSSQQTLKDMVRQYVDKNAVVVTDSLISYRGLDKEFAQHEIVNHSQDEYVNTSGFHTNTVEGFFSFLKRSIYGIYHQVSKKHLHRYCIETAYRYNTRKIKDVDRFEVTIGKCKGRLKYKDLIGK